MRVSCLGAVLAALALLAASSEELTPTPLPQAAERPHPEEIQLLEELAAWSGEAADSDPRSAFPGDRSLAVSVTSRAESFALFCQRSDDEDSIEALLSSVPYGSVIERAAARHKLDALLVVAIVEAESSFDPEAVSPRGALGLMQVMPDVASELGAENVRDPAENVEIGARYLRGLLLRFDGDLTLALAAYNAGPGSVNRYGGIPPYPETTRYVERVLSKYVGHRRAVWHAAPAVR